jgi:hypothetical protein
MFTSLPYDILPNLFDALAARCVSLVHSLKYSLPPACLRRCNYEEPMHKYAPKGVVRMPSLKEYIDDWNGFDLVRVP